MLSIPLFVDIVIRTKGPHADTIHNNIDDGYIGQKSSQISLCVNVSGHGKKIVSTVLTGAWALSYKIKLSSLE